MANPAYSVYFWPRDHDYIQKVCKQTSNPNALFLMLTQGKASRDLPNGNPGCILMKAPSGTDWDARTVAAKGNIVSAARWAYSIYEELKHQRDPKLVLSELYHVKHSCGDHHDMEGRRQICMNPEHMVLVHASNGRIVEPTGCLYLPRATEYMKPRLVKRSES